MTKTIPQNDRDMFYAFYLDEPATPSFCSFSKLYIGQKADLLKVADRLEASNCYPQTANAVRDYFSGNLSASHNIAYQTIPVLQPVNLISSSHISVGKREWNHINAWECIYKISVEGLEAEQIVVLHEEKYYRCIKATMLNPRYLGFNNQWRNIDGFVFGRESVLSFGKTEAGVALENLLYVVEDSSESANEQERKMNDPNELIFDRILDEVFGDG